MDSLKFVFAVDETYDLTVLDGILEDLPDSVNTANEFQNLTGILLIYYTYI